MDLPDKIKDKPTVPDQLYFIWRAFWELSSDRHIGMAEGPIPWSSIDRYAQRYEIYDLDEFDYFSLLIKAMDVEYMAFRAKQHKKANSKIGGSQRSFIPPKNTVGSKGMGSR